MPSSTSRAALLLMFLLAACGGGGSQEVACDLQYWDGTYGTCLPEGWAPVDAETLRQRGVPEGTIAVFQADTAVSGQFPTVAVTREALAQPMEPAAYSEASVRSVTVLPGYQLIDERDARIDAATVTLHVFSAQPAKEEPSRRFSQVSTVVGNFGYTVTGTTPVSVDDSIEEQVLLVLRESTFEEPEEE